MKRTSLKNLRLLACLGVSIACLAAGRAWGDGAKYVSDGSAFTDGTAPAGAGITYGFGQANGNSGFQVISSGPAPSGVQPSEENSSIELGESGDDKGPNPPSFNIGGGPSENSPAGAGSNSDTKDERSPPSNDNSTKSPDSATPEPPSDKIASDTSNTDFESPDSVLRRCQPGQCVGGQPPNGRPEPPTCTGPALKCCVANQPDYCHTSYFDCRCP